MKKLLPVLLFTLLAMGCGDSPVAPSQNPNNPPVITLFAADQVRLTLLLNQSTMLRWEVADQNATVRIDPFPGNVPSIGSAPVLPTVVGTLNFVLTATNSSGSSQRFVTVVVQ